MNILSLFPDPIQDPTLHGAYVGLTVKHQSGLNVEPCLGPAILTADGGWRGRFGEVRKLLASWAFLMVMLGAGGAGVGGIRTIVEWTDQEENKLSRMMKIFYILMHYGLHTSLGSCQNSEF